MTVSLSRESRYRNIASTGEIRRSPRSVPIGLIAVGGALILAMCCGCLGLFLGLQVGPGISTTADAFTTRLPVIGGPTVTPTLDRTSVVALRRPGRMDNGLEVTVTGFQRPLKVQGNVPLPPDQQFFLVTVKIRNTKTSGAAIKVTAADFSLRGDGGLTYPPNPKTLTIPNLLTEANLAPGKDIEAELIFQIAADDSGLRLQFKSGTQTRTFIAEETK
jgi:hypothetical protein